MSIPLTDIKGQTGPIPGGNVNLYLAEADEVATIPDDTDGVISTDITLEAAATIGFKKFEFAPGTCRLSHPSVGEDGAGSFDTLIDVIIDGDDGARLNLFEKMINGRFIAIVDAASNNIKVAGTKRAPLICRQINYDSGADNPDRNAFTFQFKSRQGHLSKQYTGVVPTV
jgi:hypothetical protein